MATQVAIGDLSTWLSNQPANTVDTPYEISIVGLQTSDFPTTSPYDNPIKTALLSNSTKYVDLRTTELPSGITKLESTFYECANLVYSPAIPNGVTGLGLCFHSCSSLKEAPVIPNTVNNLNCTFMACTSLIDAPLIPINIVVDCFRTFAFCTSLKYPPLFEGANNNLIMGECFRGCTALEYKPIIPSNVSISTDCFLDVTQTRWGGSTSQLESYVQSETNEFEVWEIEADTENNCYEPTGKKVFGVDIANYVPWSYQQEFNSPDNPYGLKTLGLTTSNYTDLEDIGYNRDIFVDLRYTDLPSGITSIKELFSHMDNLVYPPTIPNTVTDMEDAFNNCRNLKEPPVIPSGVITMKGTFYQCVRLESAPVIPNTVTNLSYTFSDCQSITTTPTIPSSVTNMEGTFDSCGITTPPTIPSSVTNLNYAFTFCPLTSAPVIPSSVTSMDNAFSFNSHITEVAIIPSSVTSAVEAFKNCSSLRKIDEFQIPLNTLKNNADFQNMFQGCTSLESIGYVIKESNWHVWRLKFGNDTVEGKVFFDENTSVNIPQTSIAKSDLNLPVLTDELWFPTESDTDIDELIGKMIQFKYGMYKKETIPPDEKTMVLWADDKDHFMTNIEMGGGDPVDVVELDNMNPVTSNAVAVEDAKKLGAKMANSYYGMTAPDGTDNVWIRTTSQGIIPYQSGGRTAGHNYLGTSSWYFGYGYVQNMYVNKLNLSTTAGTENGDIWIS